MTLKKSTTYAAPGQGLGGTLECVREFMEKENGAASRLFGGRLSNAFVVRTCVAGVASALFLVRVMLTGVLDGWTATAVMAAAMTLTPAMIEYVNNVKED